MERRPVPKSGFKSAADLRDLVPGVEAEAQASGRKNSAFWMKARQLFCSAIFDKAFFWRRRTIGESLSRILTRLWPARKKDDQGHVNRKESLRCHQCPTERSHGLHKYQAEEGFPVVRSAPRR